MNQDLQDLLHKIREKRNFVPSEWIEKKCAMMNDYMSKAGLSACVLSLSGGVDSSCTLALLLHAQKQPGSPIKKVLSIAQPIHSTKSIQDRAYEVAGALGADIITVDQTSLHTQLSGIVTQAVGVAGCPFADGQLRSYMRTPVAYYTAQLLSANGFPCVVVGTGNLDEDGYLLYFCKAGDGISDVQLIADIHKSEVYKTAAALKVPDSVLHAPPSADLWEGQTDEDEMGVSYDFVELYTEWLQLPANEQKSIVDALSPESLAYWNEKSEKIDTIHRRNKHKLVYPLNLDVFPSSLELKPSKL